MSLRLNIARIDEHRSIVLGVVKEVKPGTGAAAGRVMNVKLEGAVYNRENEREEAKVLDIAFWNTDTSKMADRIEKAKVREGSILTVDVYEKAGKYTGNNFKYKGHWQIPEKGEVKERNVFMGVVASMQTGEAPSSGNKYTRISIPVDKIGEENPEWVSITFWNSPTSNIADRAAKCLGGRDGKKARAVVICGPTKEYEGRTQYTGYDFALIS